MAKIGEDRKGEVEKFMLNFTWSNNVTRYFISLQCSGHSIPGLDVQVPWQRSSRGGVGDNQGLGYAAGLFLKTFTQLHSIVQMGIYLFFKPFHVPSCRLI